MGFFSAGFRRSKQYEYKPRYYNERKEELEKVKRWAKAKNGKNGQTEKEIERNRDVEFRPRFREMPKKEKNFQENYQKVRFILLVVATALAATIVYLVMKFFYLYNAA